MVVDLCYPRKHTVPATNVLDVAASMREITPFSTITLVRLCQINLRAVFTLVLVHDSIALIITRFTDQPAKKPFRIIRIGDPGFFVLAMDRENVVFGDGTSMTVAFIACPPLHASNERINAWSKAMHGIT